MKQVELYTDGACSGNPGAGGYGAILIYKGLEKEISGGEPLTTNNRMEIYAVIAGLECLKEKCRVNIYSDSAYTVNAFTQNWLEGWIRNGWRKADGKEVANSDLWQRLYDLTESHEVRFIKVKGHADNAYNNRCDELARAAIKNLQI
ncbi:ribonuclease HI [Candidatus Borkfalkia ceftriaxoniphila]|jgi:ribonuclease H|uniref:Ribonuclease H n=1 Tax=Candidatus Borkfalkia ceftriaxoniphila TaxID=2508949 RepID=A0A4Q2K996_9FIRM|nr:ribonuclease HI [Candidatus Borkfalkia ceftriaxoniphila]RXZ57947.1 ribonuclease HI [Candidatus Borkfalkia ceftriaxoniphila]